MENLLKYLESHNVTLGSVESMTGGLFASTFTSVPGVSKVFKGSIVTYWSEVKRDLVGVKAETIQKYGVVSEQVAYEMAKEGRIRLGVDVCVAVTGNAGPTCEPGGKPVGCFYVAVATKNGVKIQVFKKHGKRNDIRNMAVLAMRDEVYLSTI